MISEKLKEYLKKFNFGDNSFIEFENESSVILNRENVDTDLPMYRFEEIDLNELFKNVNTDVDFLKNLENWLKKNNKYYVSYYENVEYFFKELCNFVNEVESIWEERLHFENREAPEVLVNLADDELQGYDTNYIAFYAPWIKLNDSTPVIDINIARFSLKQPEPEYVEPDEDMEGCSGGHCVKPHSDYFLLRTYEKNEDFLDDLYNEIDEYFAKNAKKNGCNFKSFTEVVSMVVAYQYLQDLYTDLKKLSDQAQANNEQKYEEVVYRLTQYIEFQSQVENRPITDVLVDLSIICTKAQLTTEQVYDTINAFKENKDLFRSPRFSKYTIFANWFSWRTQRNKHLFKNVK